MRKERAFIVRMHEHKKFARAFFLINSCRSATTPFILLAQSTVVVVCCSSLRSDRIFAPSISPCRSLMSMQQRQPLRSWFGASEARSCRSTYNASSVTQRYPMRKHISGRQNSRVASTNCQSKKSIATLLINVITEKALQRWMKAFGFTRSTLAIQSTSNFRFGGRKAANAPI